jgi:MFS family permease
MTEPTTAQSAEPERGPVLLVNALLGGVATVVFLFLPLSPVFGGAIAGYLQGPDRRTGLQAGAVAGVVALVPLVLLALLFGGALFAFVPFGAGTDLRIGIGFAGALVLLVLLFSLAFGGVAFGLVPVGVGLEGDPRIGAGLVGALVLLALLFAGVFLAFVLGGIHPDAYLPFGMGPFGVLGLFALLLVVLLGLGYTVGLSALGGLLGAYLNREFE